jgi:cytochrome P450
MNIMRAIPSELAKKLSPPIGDLLECKDVGLLAFPWFHLRTTDNTPHQKTKRNIEEVQATIKKGVKTRRRTIFHQLLDPELNAASCRELTVENMAEEAFSMSVAASDTTGNAMTVAAYHVITNSDIYECLTKELRDAFPDVKIGLILRRWSGCLTSLVLLIKEGGGKFLADSLTPLLLIKSLGICLDSHMA